MTLIALQDIIAAHPAGSFIDLGAGQYIDNGNPTAKQGIKFDKPITVKASGAKLFTTASALRNRPGVLCTSMAAGVNLLGDLEIIMPAGKKNDHLEAQHGIETRGTPSPTVEWTVREAQGNSYYFGRDALTNAPTTNLTLTAPKSTNPGRAHIGLQAVKGFTITKAYLDNCRPGHSSIVFEPNGHNDLCQDGLIDGVTYKGNTGFCFSAGSGYANLPNGQLSNVVLRHAISDTPFGMHIGAGVNQRFGPFIGYDLRGGSVGNVSQVRCWNVDQLAIVGYHQRMSGTTSPWEMHDCPKALLTLAA
jgi:hypothetical protein